MERPLCVVFADAFAFSCYKKLDGLKDYKLCKINPGIGYSSNLHYILFDGKGPDDVGFFTDYCWGESQPKKVGALQRSCDDIVTLNNLYRFFRRKFTKKSDNIPFSEASYFSTKGKYKFMLDGDCYVFGRKVSKAYERDYKKSFERANQYIEDGSDGIVVVLEELDHFGHEVGSEGKKYVGYATEILRETRCLFDKFEKKFSNAICVLISDHGMSDVVCSVDIIDGLKKRFGLPGEKYQFYNDSVYLRLWTNDRNTLSKLKNHFDCIDVLALVDDVERKKHKTENIKFGQLIYRLKEGYVFEPNCFGVAIRGGARGIHGYMEPTDKASGILVTRELLQDTIDATGVYEQISTMCCRP